MISAISDIWALLDDDQTTLDERLLSLAKSDVDLNNQVGFYLLENGGKRIRPMVLLLLARALSVDDATKFSLATAIEYIHTATLLHDDVVDDSKMRRGKPTAAKQFGNAASVLVGDFLYTRAFQLITQNQDASVIMAEATNELAKGEVMQLMHSSNYDLSEAEYRQVIHLKTAVLFRAASRLAGTLAKRPELDVMLGEYGMQLGNAFQIADDLLDYVGDITKTGKDIGDDLAEGKMTLPIIYARDHATADDQQALKRILAERDREAITPLIEILTRSGALDYTRREAFKVADFAKASIADFPDSTFKTAMLALPDLAVRRHS